MEHVLDYEADVVLISETWFKSKKNNVTSTIGAYGYTIYHTIRKDRKKETGGGVGIIVKKGLNSKMIKVKQFQTFEHCAVKIKTLDKWITYVSIYRLIYEDMDLFFKEITELLELFAVSENCIIAGDINIHCDSIDNLHTVQLNDLLEAFGLTQYINSPTHKKGHTLDVVIARQEGVPDKTPQDITPQDKIHQTKDTKTKHPKT